jgi:hypothetical protein
MPNVLFLGELARVVRQRRAAGSPLTMEAWARVTACGTAHCLAGWAACDPFFRELGLRCVPSAGPHGALFLQRRQDGKPVYLEGFEALQELFELDDYQSNYLFGDNPWASNVDRIESWDDALSRINEVIRGEI